MYNIYFQPNFANWIKFNDVLYSNEDADYYVNWFNSLYDPVKFKKVFV